MPDSIYALLDTEHWEDASHHTNDSGISIRGTGYQLNKRLFLGTDKATSLWINQRNKFDELYHVHIYGGKGTFFEHSNFHTNEIFHAHPIENIDDRKFSIRCVCDQLK